MVLKPICRSCRRFFRPERNGYRFTEGMPNGLAEGPTPPGKDADEFWRPYKLWVGDLWRCEGCGAEIVVGVVSHSPVSEHFMPNFEEIRTSYGFDQLQVNDC